MYIFLCCYGLLSSCKKVDLQIPELFSCKDDLGKYFADDIKLMRIILRISDTGCTQFSRRERTALLCSVHLRFWGELDLFVSLFFFFNKIRMQLVALKRSLERKQLELKTKSVKHSAACL